MIVFIWMQADSSDGNHREVVALPDPIGEALETNQLENSLVITKTWAMGVIGITKAVPT